MSPRFLTFARCALAALSLGAGLAAQITKLSPPLEGRDVDSFEVSPDGRYAVYRARQQPGLVHLFSHGLPDGGLKRLEDFPLSGGGFEISGDSRRVVYLRAAAAFQLCSVPIDGSEDPVVLGPSSTFKVTPDGQTVVFRDSEGLKRVPTDGSAPAVLIHSNQPWLVHHVFAPTPDSSRIVYVTEGSIRGEGGAGHIWSAVLDGSAAPVRLNDNQSQAAAGGFRCSTDSKWVVFRRGRIKTFSTGILSVPLDGGVPPVQLNSPPASGFIGTFTTYSSPRFSPDGTRVVFLVEADQTGDRRALYSAPIHGGGVPVQLSEPSQEWTFYHRVSLDGAQVVYLATEDSSDALALFSVPILGGTPRKLSTPGHDLRLFQLSPDGRHVAYVATSEVEPGSQLFLASLEPGPGVLQLSDPASTPRVAADLPGALAFDAQGTRIAYASFQVGSNSIRQLRAVRTDGSAPPVRLDGPSVQRGSVVLQRPTYAEVYYMRFAADDRLAVFIADRETNNSDELWASPVEKRTMSRR